MVKDKVAEAEWKCIDVNEHWQPMKSIMMDTAQVTCGLSKGPCRHKETWWWNEEVAEAVREKRKSMEIGKRKNRQRHRRSTRRVNKMQKGYFVSKGKETEGICKQSYLDANISKTV